jgi:ATP-dependent RNA helicase SUPV3L1/SUV3
VPDFRNVMTDAHTRLLARIFTLLSDDPRGLPEDWVERQVRALDTAEADVETLLERIASIRTWTYVSHRPGWLADPETWQARTRRIEDRLSDALHESLRSQFVSRGATLLARHDPDALVAHVADDGTLEVQGIPAGRLEGFRFEPLPGEASRTLRSAANKALRSGIDARVTELVESPDEAFALTSAGNVLWRDAPVGRLLPTDRTLAPQVEALASDLLDPPRRERVRRRLAEWLSAHLARALGPLLAARDGDASGAVRGLVYTLAESLGSVPRKSVCQSVAALRREERRELARAGITLGRRHVFMPALLEPEALHVRATLWSVRHPRSTPIPVGPVSLRAVGLPDPRRDAACGYERLGDLWIRIGEVEKLLAAAHGQARQRSVRPARSLARIVHSDITSLVPVLRTLGFRSPPEPSSGESRSRSRARRRNRSRRGPVVNR